MKRKVAFVHGRPSGHPLHAKYAKSVNADFYYEDRLLRWHDIPGAPKIKRYLSWLMNALFFPNRKKYDVILTECIRIPQLLMKKIWFLNRSQKLVAMMGDESLYFLQAKRYPKLTQIIMKSFLNSCDVLICTSKFQSELAKEIVTNKNVIIKETYNGIDIPDSIKEITSYSNRRLLVLGNIESDWRMWYKGLDLILEAFEILHQQDPQKELHIIGRVTPEVKEELKSSIPQKIQDSIIFHGHSKDLFAEITDYDLVLHTARGEAWGITVQIAMAVGLPCIVSEVTGTKELVNQVDSNLVSSLNSQEIADKINWQFGLSNKEREKISRKSIQVARSYTQEKAINNFVRVFEEGLT